ncbi:hypothetical protein PAXRUDRAFT_386143 [Paxillus rubicundulus Ve08.2h10]|uniref:Uncharacterized protein n=1 Tax=Paxillus rubicundulus Ve08.2h10 TaxID=930991 RepID=A0A0D0D1B7_9AGAM|nr:hypothetical protein PAXRUDRAFT_386143 [Paxillus rubicundulus Ve08.2h10]
MPSLRPVHTQLSIQIQHSAFHFKWTGPANAIRRAKWYQRSQPPIHPTSRIKLTTKRLKKATECPYSIYFTKFRSLNKHEATFDEHKKCLR